MVELWAGSFGRYQWKQCLLHMLPGFLAGLHMLAQVEVAATPQHKCLAVNDTIIDYQGSCHYVNPLNQTLPCEKWEYDKTDYGPTITTDWDLVCDRRWMASVAQSSYMFGALVSDCVLGQVADRFGRWKVLVPTGILQLIFAVSSAFVQNYYAYVVIQFLLAINASGAYMAGFVLTMEMTPDRLRTILGLNYQIMFAIGITVVAGWAYLIHDWSYLQLCFGLHSLVMICNWWLVDESPRWLFSQGRYKEANLIVCKMLKQNGKADVIPENGFTVDQLRQGLSTGNESQSNQLETFQPQEGNQEAKDIPVEHSYGIRDLFHTPRLRLRTINICLNWFANSLIYYGLSLNTSSLVGDPHLMLFISGLIEIPSYLLSMKVIDVLGRRFVVSFGLIFGGLSCIGTTYFPKGSYEWTTATTVIVMLAKSSVSISFACVYNYTAELYPTVVRSSAIGIGSTFARLSATLTPLVFLLDSLDPKYPSILFGVVSLAAGFFTLYLPETRDSPLMHTLEQGEKYGIGDTCFAGNCFAIRSSSPEKLARESKAL